MAGIYVHIPFCARRCIYCGFFSTVREGEAARYICALCREIELRRDYIVWDSVRTLYFGGGTPSRLSPEFIGLVLDRICSFVNPDNLSELTVECNPDDITPEFVLALHTLGVNRISMGVQTFDDRLLGFLGRRHTSNQAVNAVRICKDAGFDNISIDLMYGLPGQSESIQLHDLETAVSLGVRHISSYCLSYEEDSALESMRRNGLVTPASDETCEDMFNRMCQFLHDSGYEHYEISNFCSPGYHSRHNSSYWDGTPYLGLGAGAHSYNGVSRQWNPNDLDEYMESVEKGVLKYESELLSQNDLYNECVMLSLRTVRGLDLSILSQENRRYIMQSASSLISGGSLILENNHLRIPESRMFISDAIISALFK